MTWVDSRDVRASKKKIMQNIYLLFYWTQDLVSLGSDLCLWVQMSLTHPLTRGKGGWCPIWILFFLAEWNKAILIWLFSNLFAVLVSRPCLGWTIVLAEIATPRTGKFPEMCPLFISHLFHQLSQNASSLYLVHHSLNQLFSTWQIYRRPVFTEWVIPECDIISQSRDDI